MLEKLLKKLNIQDWIGKDAVIKVELVRTVRDWKSWLATLRVDPEGALLLDATAIHAFLFLRRKGHEYMLDCHE
eukprot:3191297-Heterocapsa_arctica.AAC.1